MLSWNEQGVSNETDWFYKLVSGITEIKTFPITEHKIELDLVNVDFAAEFISFVGLYDDTKEKVFHVLNNNENLFQFEKIFDSIEKFVPSNNEELQLWNQHKAENLFKFQKIPFLEWKRFVSSRIERECHNSFETGTKNKKIMALEYFSDGTLPSDVGDKIQKEKSYIFLKGLCLNEKLSQYKLRDSCPTIDSLLDVFVENIVQQKVSSLLNYQREKEN